MGKTKSKKAVMRRCIGCMESKPKDSLIRIACYGGRLSIDPTGGADGRGAYLCKNSRCMAAARKKRGLERSLGIRLSPKEADEIFRELSRYEE